MKAYILINIQIGMTVEVLRNLKSLTPIQNAEMTFGDYDAIAVVQVEDLHALAKLVSTEIQSVPGITQTVTCMAVDL